MFEVVQFIDDYQGNVLFLYNKVSIKSDSKNAIEYWKTTCFFRESNS